MDNQNLQQLEHYAKALEALHKLFKPHPKQIAPGKALFYEGKKRLFLCLGRRFGKALSLDTLIPTTKGLRPMSEIQPGDKVFDEQGKQCNVIAISDVHERPCYEVNFGACTITAADTHEWVTFSKNEKKKGRYGPVVGKIRTTEEMYTSFKYLRKDGKFEANYNIDFCAPLEMEEQKLPVDPYILGAWLGDGT